MSASERVYHCGDVVNEVGEIQRANRYAYRACRNRAKFDRDGKHFCAIHDPVTIKAKRDAKTEARRSAYAQELAFRERAKARTQALQDASVERLARFRQILGLPAIAPEFRYEGHEPDIDGVRIDRGTGGLQFNAEAVDALLTRLEQARGLYQQDGV